MNIIYNIVIQFILTYICNSISVNEYEVNTINDFKNALFSSSNVIININQNLTIIDNIIHDIPKSNIVIRGKGINVTSIEFNMMDSSIYYTFNFSGNECNFVFENITIIGSVLIRHAYNVDFRNINFKGYIDIENYSEMKSNVTISNCNFYTGKHANLRQAFVHVSKKDLYIRNSNFYGGGDSTTKNLLLFTGSKRIYNLNIIDSVFNGMYLISGIDDKEGNIFIQNTIFENLFSYEHGGALKTEISNVILRNTTYKNVFASDQGGSLYITNPYELNIQNTYVYNATAINGGGLILLISSEDQKIKGFVINTVFINPYKDTLNQQYGKQGLIASIVQYSNLYIENFYGEGFIGSNGGSLFFSIYDSTLELKNIKIQDVIGYGAGGMFYSSIMPISKGNQFYATNCTLSNLFHLNSNSGSLLISAHGGIVKLNKCEFTDLNTDSAGIVYTYDNAKVTFDDVLIDRYKAHNYVHLFENSNFYNDYENAFIHLNNVSLRNLEFSGAIFDIKNVNINYYNQNCIHNNYDCFNDDYKCLIGISIDYKGVLSIQSTLIENIFSDRGITTALYSYSYITNTTIKNSFFKNGFTRIDGSNSFGIYDIKKLNFLNNTSIKGTFINQKSGIQKKTIVVEDSIFTNNEALKYGGIVYSEFLYGHDAISFNNCEFNNNSAIHGIK
ncbi:hypothetical protein U3516DRAFT_561150 [Neocallimastix sp. 'constans']